MRKNVLTEQLGRRRPSRSFRTSKRLLSFQTHSHPALLITHLRIQIARPKLTEIQRGRTKFVRPLDPLQSQVRYLRPRQTSPQQIRLCKHQSDPSTARSRTVNIPQISRGALAINKTIAS